MSNWNYEILRNLMRGNKRFNEFEKSGIPTKSLSDKLRELADNNYIERRILSTRPPRTEYKITGKGKRKFKKLVLETAPNYVEDLFLVDPEKAKRILMKYGYD